MDEIILKLREEIGPEIIVPAEKPTPEVEKTTPKPTSTGPLKGKIASVTETPPQAYINLGSESGIKIGDKFTVYTQGKAITDPDTGELLGHEEEMAGSIEIVDVMSGRMSKGKILSGAGKVKRLDVVKLALED